jgi:hypothetical protein
MNKKILEMIKDVEFSSDNTKLLHKNDGEKGLTYFGIYESAHPNWYGWNIIKKYLDLDEDYQEYKKTENDKDLSLALKKCSRILSNVSDLNFLVEDFYKKEFFNKMKLDLVKSEHKQLEIMCFAINVGIVPTAKVLQRLLNVTVDGLIGQQTIKALNAFDEELFDKLFDIAEIEYYDKLVTNKERFKIYQKGWHNRANVI